MSPVQDFVTVDMRGLKGALIARARSERVSVSMLMREAVARHLGVEPRVPSAIDPIVSTASHVKVSVRMTRAEADQLATGTRASGLSRSAYVAGLIAEVPILSERASWGDHLAALVASNSELSTLSRNIAHLTALLREGEVRPALEYAEMLNTLGRDERGHLALASRSLKGLRPRRGTSQASEF
jgi:hypothetical protein